MASQYFFQNRLPDLLMKVPQDERQLSPITEVQKTPLHLVFLVQEQTEECLHQIESLFALNGKEDSANTNSRFEIVVVRRITTACDFFSFLILMFPARKNNNH